MRENYLKARQKRIKKITISLKNGKIDKEIL